MNVTKYYCDKCNQEVPGWKSLIKINLTIKLDENRAPTYTKEICMDCIAEFGFSELTDRNYISNFNVGEKNVFSIIKKIFGRSNQ